jgi:hypothetical protein
MQKSTHLPTLEKLQRTKEQLYLTVNKQEQVLKLQLACLPGETLSMAFLSLLPQKAESKIGGKALSLSVKAIDKMRIGINKGLMSVVKKEKKPLTQTGYDLKKKEKTFLPSLYRAYKLFKKYKVV